MELCQQLERLMCKFWWRSNWNKDKHIHWQSWSNMSKCESNWVMGFRDTWDFNIALLENQGWHLLWYPKILVIKIYKARYYPHGSFLNVKIRNNPSFIWRSVLESQSVVKQGVGCRVGNGQSICIFEDPWLLVKGATYNHPINEALQE